MFFLLNSTLIAENNWQLSRIVIQSQNKTREVLFLAEAEQDLFKHFIILMWYNKFAEINYL